MRLSMAVGIALFAGFVPGAYAIDHKNLDEGRPLRLEDAYTVASGEWALEAGAGVIVPRRGSDRAVLEAQILYGAFPNFQVSLGSELSTDPGEIEEQTKSGDLQLEALYNLNQETLVLPAFAGKLALNFPTGVDSSGTDVELKAIATKSFDRLSVHLNAGYAFLTGTDREERDGRYAFAVGASYPIGAPRYTRTTLVGDVFVEQGARQGDATIVGVEAGFRHQLTPRVVWDAGAGTEFAGPADRSSFFFTTGLSIGF